ncbi:unnamed protein product [Parnassius apollo]|uniref:Glutathione synthetase n=1 Tax=Parnassius apollo TaxID=110799 RepID=A0A8S3XMC6_PARAO|nr:unnamed protein product [Parnassius apollo]
MSQARLASCIPLPLEHKLLVTVIEKAKDWALMHGVGMRDKKHFTKDSIQIAPFVLLPSPFPRTEFEKAIELQPVLNELMHKVAHDDEFLEHTLQNALQVDEFTANLYDIWIKVRQEGVAQSISLGLFRSDYLMQCTEANRIKQVEFNTIAASFGAMTSNLPAMFRYILRQLGRGDLIKNMPENHALSGLCAGITEAFHEFEISEKRPDIQIYRKTLNEIYEETTLNDKKQLIFDGRPVAVVYYRSGYEPAQYPSSREWDARLRVERSTAIKCPSIHYQLAGTKKVQQTLASPPAS